jgi:beta-N-acetylhexosaminidase
MSAGVSADPVLERMADAILIPPFPGKHAPRWVLAALERGLAGVTIFGPNIAGPEQLAGLTAQLRSAGGLPLVAIDEEGGDVTRIAHLTGSPYPGNAALGAVDDVDLTAAVHRALGQDLAALGINVNLAPSVDVNTAADNPVIGIRSFGSDPDLVARHAAAAVRGLQAAGVAACAKHFPGHGSTSADSHHGIVTVQASLDLLRRRDLPPFTAAIAAGVRGVMPGHLRVPELTGDAPATLSAAALNGLLRGELGFTGVIISDALEMRAVSDLYGISEAAVLAVAAGTDLLCFGRDAAEDGYLAVRRALGEAVASGRLPAERLTEAQQNVARLRTWLAGAAPGRQAQLDGTGADGAGLHGMGRDGTRLDVGRLAGPGAHIGLVAARRAVRASSITTGAAPGPLADPVVVELEAEENIAVGDVPWGLRPWVPAASVQRVPAGLAVSEAATVAEAALARAAGRSLIVVVRDAHRYPAVQAVVSELTAARPDTVVLEMGLPLWVPPAGVHLATYGAARANAQAAAEVLGLAR